MSSTNESCYNNSSNLEEELPSIWIDLFTRDLFVTLGIFGNILVLRVVTLRHMRNTFNQLRGALAVFDTLFLATALLHSLLKYSKDANGIAFPYFTWPIGNVGHTASIFMTMAIALERYVAIHDPHRYRRNQRNRTRRYVAAVTISALSLNITKFFEFEVGCRTMINTTTGITITKMYMTLGYVIYNSIILNLVIKGLIPISVLICIYTKIYAKFKKQDTSNIRSATNEQKRTMRQEKMARTFAGVVIVSLIATIPDVAIKIIDLYFIATSPIPVPCGDPPQWYLNGTKVRNFLVALNSVINIVIYTFLDKKFRKECRQNVLRSCKCNNASSMSPIERDSMFR